MQASSPRVAIGLPVYNGARYLREALDSWLAQDFEDFELVVSDNASTDDTPEILAGYASRDPRIRIVRRPCTVPACDNFNGLLDEVASPLFAWAACDDLREPTFLSRMVTMLDEDPELVLAYCQVRYFGDERRMRRHADEGPLLPGTEPTKLGRVISILRTRAYPMVYGLIRLDVLKTTQLFVWPMGIAPDVALCLELATRGRMGCVQEPLMSFRLHPDSLAVSHDDPMYEGVQGRRLDEPVRSFVETLPLDPVERRLFLRELSTWCRKAQKPRRLLWRSAGFRSIYVHGSRALIDLSRALRRV